MQTMNRQGDSTRGLRMHQCRRFAQSTKEKAMANPTNFSDIAQNQGKGMGMGRRNGFGKGRCQNCYNRAEEQQPQEMEMRSQMRRRCRRGRMIQENA